MIGSARVKRGSDAGARASLDIAALSSAGGS